MRKMSNESNGSGKSRASKVGLRRQRSDASNASGTKPMNISVPIKVMKDGCAFGKSEIAADMGYIMPGTAVAGPQRAMDRAAHRSPQNGSLGLGVEAEGEMEPVVYRPPQNVRYGVGEQRYGGPTCETSIPRWL
jgi:hypothetical protein